MKMTADELDHRDTQYQECVPFQVPGGYVALVTMYHPLSQTLTLRMAASRDGRQWWFPDRVACLDNAPPGRLRRRHDLAKPEPDSPRQDPLRLLRRKQKARIARCPTPACPRNASTRWRRSPINRRTSCRSTRRCAVPGWRIDRMYALASSAGGPSVGEAVTTAREIGGRALWVDLRTRPAKKASQPGLHEGCLRVELLDKAGKPLAGFTADDCAPLRGDHEALQVKWTGGDNAPVRCEKGEVLFNASVSLWV